MGPLCSNPESRFSTIPRDIYNLLSLFGSYEVHFNLGNSSLQHVPHFQAACSGSVRELLELVDVLRSECSTRLQIYQQFHLSASRDAKALFWMIISQKNQISDYLALANGDFPQDFILSYNQKYALEPYMPCLRTENELVGDFTTLITSCPHVHSIEIRDFPRLLPNPDPELIDAIRGATTLQCLNLSAYLSIDFDKISLHNHQMLRSLTCYIKEEQLPSFFEENTWISRLNQFNVLTPIDTFFTTNTLNAVGGIQKFMPRTRGLFFEKFPHLQLTDLKEIAFSITKENIAAINSALQQLPSLTHLSLKVQNSEDLSSLIKTVCELRHLTHFACSKELVPLAVSLPQISSLDLNLMQSTEITSIMESLAQKSGLIALSIQTKEMTTEQAQQLSQAKNIQRLCITFSCDKRATDHFNEVGLQALAQIPTLKQCIISGNRKVTPLAARTIIQKSSVPYFIFIPG